MTRMKMTRMTKLGFWSASCGTFIPSTAVTHICPTLSTLGKHFMQDCKYKNTNTNTNIQIQLHPFNIGKTFCARQHKILQNYGYHSHPSMIGYNCTKFIHSVLETSPSPDNSSSWAIYFMATSSKWASNEAASTNNNTHQCHKPPKL